MLIAEYYAQTLIQTSNCLHQPPVRCVTLNMAVAQKKGYR